MTPDHILDDIVLNNYRRCNVENYTTRTILEQLLVTVPHRYCIKESSKWYNVLKSDLKSIIVEFTNEKFTGLIDIVATNPMCNQVQSGMHLTDYESGFGNHNNGCTINFVSKKQTLTILLTWKEIIGGRKNGIQVWQISDTYRDIFSNFADRSKVSHGLTALFNSLYNKVYGDRLQSLHLINCFNRATMKNQNKSIRKYQTII